jgi:hypothetical protein
MSLTPDEHKELTQLEAAFNEAGGRGIELAERIDELRRKDTVRNYGVHPNWKHWEEPTAEDTVTLTLEGQEFLLQRKDALALGQFLRDVTGTKEVLA